MPRTFDFSEKDVLKFSGLLYGNLPLSAEKSQFGAKYTFTSLPKPAYVRFELLHCVYRAGGVFVGEEKIQHHRRGASWVITSESGQLTAGYDSDGRGQQHGRFALFYSGDLISFIMIRL